MPFTAWMLAVFGFCFMTEEELTQRQKRTGAAASQRVGAAAVMRLMHPSHSLTWADVFQRYDSTGAGRILQVASNHGADDSHCDGVSGAAQLSSALLCRVAVRTTCTSS